MPPRPAPLDGTTLVDLDHGAFSIPVSRSTVIGEALKAVFGQALVPLIGLLALWLIASMYFPSYRTSGQLTYLLTTASFLGIVALGQTFVITSGGIDLSVSGVITLSAVVCSQLLSTKVAAEGGAIAIALLASLLIGVMNGAGVLFLRLHPLVMTLAMTSMIEGGLLLYTNGAPLSTYSQTMDQIGGGRWLWGIPNPVLIWLVLVILSVWLLHFHRFGRHVVAVGLNASAARIAGVPVGWTTIVAYGMSGLLAGVSGVLILGYLSMSYLTMGAPYQLGAIAAAVVGGTSILGGRGSALGAAVGALTLTLLTSVLTVMRMEEGVRQIIYGSIIIAVFFGTLFQKSAGGEGLMCGAFRMWSKRRGRSRRTSSGHL